MRLPYGQVSPACWQPIFSIGEQCCEGVPIELANGVACATQNADPHSTSAVVTDSDIISLCIRNSSHG
jgi:hypothetical protein